MSLYFVISSGVILTVGFYSCGVWMWPLRGYVFPLRVQDVAIVMVPTVILWWLIFESFARTIAIT